MKKIFYLFSIILLMGQVSCGEFLKESSGNLLIPKNVYDFAALLNGEGYPDDFPRVTGFITLMSDDIEMGPHEGGSWDGFNTMTGGDGLWAYRWDLNIEEKLIDGAWDMCYAHILGCNTVIQALPTMTYDPVDIDLYNSLAASAYALRAYHYFCLINWYAVPYSKENLSKLGVVIKTIPNVTLANYERSTIGQVYELINEDIRIAREYSKNARPTANKFLLSDAAIEFLASRINLFQEKWEDVIHEGEAFIKLHQKLFDLNSVADKTTFGSDKFTMLKSDNPEILFTFGNSSSSPYPFLCINSLFKLGFQVNLNGNNALLSMYDQEHDWRYQAYFKKNDKNGYYNNYPMKYTGLTNTKLYMVNWRNVEVFLNVAEAYARTEEGISTRAIDLLNNLRKARYDNTYVPLKSSDFATKDALLKFVWDERRRELAFEETMRWWDLRRQGCKQIIHAYYSNDTSFATYILPENSPNFVLQIPFSETGVNSVITGNIRENIKAK